MEEKELEPEATENKKSKKKRLLAALVNFRKNLKGTCGSFEMASGWYDFLKGNLEPVLTEFKDVLGEKKIEEFKKFTQLTDESKEALQKACQALGGDVSKLIKYYTPKNLLGQALNGILATGALAAIASLVYFNLNPAEITIKNEGCAPIKAPVSLVINLPALSFPQEPIPDGGQGVAKLPPVKLTVETSETASQKSILLKAFGLTLNFVLEGNDIDINYNSKSLLAGLTTIDLSQKTPHEITVSCTNSPGPTSKKR